ncbi:hypothetical protein CLU79DRAFT_781602 [Phycomyces nitens]|nr:hypothetical protein CLU79DRAFT_783035 [Phycomyces nitens]KAI9005465.1 hypothetical protein CLU79DRAFT_781602 [Phycomyces nitens]
MVTPSYFLSSFNKTVREKLIMEDFWVNKEPCHWTLLYYLEVLVKQDPAISRRNASLFLLADSKIIKENVVAGTVAETKVNAMLTYSKNSRAKKAFSTFFAEFAESISKNAMNYNIQKYRLRSSMAQQVADDEEENTQKRGLVSNDNGEESGSDRKKIKPTINNDEEYDEDGEKNEAEGGIWKKWKQFLDDPKNTQHLMQLSPEKHHIIWYGKLLRRRSCLPSDLYSKLNEEVSYIEDKYISPCFFDGAMAVVDAVRRC